MDSWLSLFGGLALLMFGGELLVRGAVQVANKLGVSPLVIGLTLVGFGTSTPELVTSLQAALSGAAGIAYGNIVGSNIANILLILGGAALLSPVFVTSRALRRDSMTMVGVTLLFLSLSLFQPFGRLTGAIFLALLCLYVLLAFRQELRPKIEGHGALYEKSSALQEADGALVPEKAGSGPLAISLLIALCGLGLVVLGGHFLVEGAVILARKFGVSETLIGLTIVAVGTSMPELVTSAVAAWRKEADVAFGNIVGSNIYNILGIGGATALISPIEIPDRIIAFDNYVMLAASILLVVFAYTKMRISRWEGGILVCGYVGYIALNWPS